MQLTRHRDPAAFRDQAATFLEAGEAMNSKFFGVVRDAINGRYADRETLWLTAERSAEVIGAAIWTGPDTFAAAHNCSTEAACALAHRALAHSPDALGLLRVSPSHAKALAESLGRTFERTEALGVYELVEVRAPEGVRGMFRSALPDDIDRLARFAGEFAKETGAFRYDVNDLRTRVASMVDNNVFGVWDDDGIVSMAATRGPTPHGIRLSWVYTPPSMRGNGFASAVVAGLSQRELDDGRAFCCLFTNLENPRSNGIYRRIGYRQIGELGIYRS